MATPSRVWLKNVIPPSLANKQHTAQNVADSILATQNRKENVALPIMWLANNTHMAFDMWLASNTPPRNWGTISNEWTRWGHTGAAAGGDVQPRALFSLLTNESDYEAKPSVLLLGQ